MAMVSMSCRSRSAMLAVAVEGQVFFVQLNPLL